MSSVQIDVYFFFATLKVAKVLLQLGNQCRSSIFDD